MDTTRYQWRQDAADAARMDATRSQLLYSQSHLTFLFPVIAALFLCALLWDVAERPVMLAWLAMIASLALIRFRMLQCIGDDRHCDSAGIGWLNIFAFSALLSGLLWGAAPMVIVSEGPDCVVQYDLYRGLVTLVVCGLVAGATLAYASTLRVLFSFSVPALVPPGCYFITLGDRFSGSLGGFVLLYLAFISVAGLRMHLQLRRFIELEYELARLRRDLAGDGSETAGAGLSAATAPGPAAPSPPAPG